MCVPQTGKQILADSRCNQVSQKAYRTAPTTEIMGEARSLEESTTKNFGVYARKRAWTETSVDVGVFAPKPPWTQVFVHKPDQ